VSGLSPTSIHSFNLILKLKSQEENMGIYSRVWSGQRFVLYLAQKEQATKTKQKNDKCNYKLNKFCIAKEIIKIINRVKRYSEQ
jgi:hypothetical protein